MPNDASVKTGVNYSSLDEFEKALGIDDCFMLAGGALYQDRCANCNKVGYHRKPVQLEKGNGQVENQVWCEPCIALNCLRRGRIASAEEAIRQQIPDAPKSPWGSL